MVHFKNGFISYLLFHLFKHSITRSESTTTVHIVPGEEVFLNCSKDSFITVKNTSVLNMGNCGNRQTDCTLNSNDQKLINECDGSPKCRVDGSLLKSACLWEDLYFDISYKCKASYEYEGCYEDNQARVLDEEHKNNKAMSADICFNICTENQTSYKHIYFGTQYGHECFCGDGQELNSKSYPRKKDSECNITCLQNENEKCGGSYRMSVYKIETQISRYNSCLEVNQQNSIQDCKTYLLQKEGFCVKYDVSNYNKATDQSCRYQDFEIGRKLYETCANTKRDGDCVYNLKNILTTGNISIPPTKQISIVYSCKEDFSTISSTLIKSVTSDLTFSDSVTSSSTFSNYDNFSTIKQDVNIPSNRLPAKPKLTKDLHHFVTGCIHRYRMSYSTRNRAIIDGIMQAMLMICESDNSQVKINTCIEQDTDLDSQLTELLQQSTSDWKTDNASDRNNCNQPNKQQKLCIFKTPLKSSMG